MKCTKIKWFALVKSFRNSMKMFEHSLALFTAFHKTPRNLIFILEIFIHLWHQMHFEMKAFWSTSFSLSHHNCIFYRFSGHKTCFMCSIFSPKKHRLLFDFFFTRLFLTYFKPLSGIGFIHTYIFLPYPSPVVFYSSFLYRFFFLYPSKKRLRDITKKKKEEKEL